LIADEPTTALDVTVQRRVLELIQQVRSDNASALLLISHDIAVISGMCDRVLVMYAGRVVEEISTDELLTDPAHPYTQALVDSIPDLGRESRILPGEPASPLSPPTGCAFHPRCSISVDACSGSELNVRLEGVPGNPHQVACIERRAV
jgi:peptide/nickel transport system ATP-binding protein